MRKHGNRNNNKKSHKTVGVGSRPSYNNRSKGGANILSSLRPKSSLSKRVDQVYAQTQRQEICDEVILNSTPSYRGHNRHAGDVSGQGLSIFRPPSMGTTATSIRRITVKCGSSGNGALVVFHGNGGLYHPGVTSAGTSLSQVAYDVIDVLHTDGNQPYSNYDFANFDPSSLPSGWVGVTSVGSSARYAGTVTAIANQMASIVGQSIRFVANTAAVNTRKGTIYAVNSLSHPPDLNPGVLGALPRCQAFDAADLVDDSEFTIRRPALGCGHWYDSLSAHRSYGPATGRLPLGGCTLIGIIGANNGDEFVFEIRTAVAYAGNLIPAQIPICYSSEAYNTVACGRARATNASNVTSAPTASKTGSIAKRAMEVDTVQSTPGYLHDSLWEVGGKLMGKMAPYIAGAIGL